MLGIDYKDRVYCKCSICGSDIIEEDVMYEFPVAGMEHVCEECVCEAEGHAPCDGFEDDIDE